MSSGERLQEDGVAAGEGEREGGMIKPCAGEGEGGIRSRSELGRLQVTESSLSYF